MPVTLTEIAEAIHRYLNAAEKDDDWNWIEDEDRSGRRRRYRRFYNAHARRGGSRVMVTYVSYQGPTGLTKDEAQQYLRWLEAGNRGRHFEALR